MKTSTHQFRKTTLGVIAGLALVIVGLLATLSPVFAQSAPQPSDKAMQRIVKETRHELIMLPNLGVFDYLAFKVDGYNVTVLGT